MPPHDRNVIIGKRPTGWAVVMPTRSIVIDCPSIFAAFKRGEALAAEYGARLEVALPECQGERGPRHLLNFPSVYLAEDGEGWAVAMLNRPSGFPDPNRLFVGPNGERMAKAWASRTVEAVRILAQSLQDQRDRMKALARKARREAVR